MCYGPGCLARSLAGHDKNQYFIIVSQEGEYVFLADGAGRTVAHPKRKKKKHIQAADQPLITDAVLTDELIRRHLKQYKKATFRR